VRYALKIGRFFGISVFVHWTFILVPLWVLFNGLTTGLSWLAIAVQVGLSLAVFACVLLHEYGHALTARQFGVQTRDIILLPIGGVARLESMPREPLSELIIAIAGPAVNVVIAVFLFPLVLLTEGDLAFAENEITWGGVVRFLFAVNLLLVVFNAIPAFPMDGGRVLRSVLALFLPYTTATILAARSGQLISILFFILGLVTGNPSLFLISVFVYFMATNEMRGVLWIENQKQEVAPPRPVLSRRDPPQIPLDFEAIRRAYWRMRL
jgi:Zn-dependent protease